MLTDIAWYFLIYSFLGWLIEVACCAVLKRRFCNRGFLAAPLLPSHGAAFCILIVLLPQFGQNHFFPFLVVLIVISVVGRVADELAGQAGKLAGQEGWHGGFLSGNGKDAVAGLLTACAYYAVYLVLHPLVIGISLLVPQSAKQIAAASVAAVTALDLAAVFYAVRKGKTDPQEELEKNGIWRRAVRRMKDSAWNRLQKAYPGFREMSREERESCRFAQGFCMDKLVWVFFLSALLGDGIEMLYCGIADGEWMSRSSVLYGPFSFVWGAGAVLLTVALSRLEKKKDRHVFFAGFVIGGAYEYSCSVLTEALFGTVFWDYSEMPFNIGGRTNVLFCFFWGTLSVFWVKEVYPRLSGLIESLPYLPGKILTWAMLAFMLCNAVLTMAAMTRYGERTSEPRPSNRFEAFLDERYPDSFMETRWQNMKPAAGA